MEDLGNACFKEKEEYYRRLNESLKLKAASLISQAENALKEQNDACSSFDLSSEQKEKEESATKRSLSPKNRKEVKSDNPSVKTSAQSSKEPYRVNLDQKISMNMHVQSSDSEDSISEAFSKLEAAEDEGSSTTSVVSKDLSSAAQTRLYQAKLRVAKAEIKRIRSQCKKLTRENSVLTEKCKKLEKEQQKAVACTHKHDSELGRLKRALEEVSNEAQKSKSECASWKKDAEQSSKEAQTLLASNAQSEIKLRRANEEVEKLRLAVGAERSKTKEAAENFKEKITSLEVSNQRLEKQKQELIVGFKKQMKLIDVLKRQKLHLEGAKLLQISEEEFLKVVDLNLNE